MGNIRVGTLAVLACQQGNTAPLEQLLKPLKNPLFEWLLLLTIQRSKPAKVTRRDLIGYEVGARLRTRPGAKREICHELAKQYHLSPVTVRHYHEHFTKTVEPVFRHDVGKFILREIRKR